jgi:hypothetical protein
VRNCKETTRCSFAESSYVHLVSIKRERERERDRDVKSDKRAKLREVLMYPTIPCPKTDEVFLFYLTRESLHLGTNYPGPGAEL